MGTGIALTLWLIAVLSVRRWWSMPAYDLGSLLLNAINLWLVTAGCWAWGR